MGRGEKRQPDAGGRIPKFQPARLVEARLADFRIKADVVNYSPGPVITRFELNLAPGVKKSASKYYFRSALALCPVV